MRLSQGTEPLAWEGQRVSWLNLALLTVAFGIAHAQYPLYYFVQNQHFFHGLKKAGYGFLSRDWLSGTADVWPVFSAVVAFTYRYLDQRLFYVYYVLLLGVYSYSVLGIASTLFGIDRSRPRFLAYMAVITALHSPVFQYVSTKAVGFDAGPVLLEGVASQRLLYDMLQPSAFGVFLLLSIHLFLRGRPFPAVLSAAVAGWFHPVYILMAGVLTWSFIGAMARRGDDRQTRLRLGWYALALALPMIVYMIAAFRPTALDLWVRSQAILVHFRLPRHALVATWLDTLTVARIAIVLLGLYILRRTPLFGIMKAFFIAAVGLTLMQVLTRNDTLALVFPWRFSTLLVPLSTLMIFAHVLSRLMDGLERRVPSAGSVVSVLSVLVLVGFVTVGGIETARRFDSNARLASGTLTGIGTRTYVISVESGPVMRHIRATKTAADSYVIPRDWRYFRLFTGAPAFIEFWFIPYNDVAVMEWYTRVRLADAFYTANGEARCQMLRELSRTYSVTHVVVRAGDSAACGGWQRVFGDGNYALFKLTS